MLSTESFKGKKKTGPSVEESAHSRMGPSSSERWLVCTPSVEYTKDMPDKDSTYAMEGTAAHILSEWCRARNVPAKNFKGHQINVAKVDGTTERFIVDMEMVDAVQQFVDYCADLPSDMELFEERVRYTAWVPEHGWGTLDDGRIHEDSKTAYVTDLKYGKGIQVFAKANTQLMLYALGMFQDYGHLFDMDKFILAVHQPRLGHVDTWEISAKDLLTWANTYMQPRAEMAIKGEGEFVAGDHCRFCPAKNICGARAQWAQDSVVGQFENLEASVEAGSSMLSNDELSELLPVVGVIKSWCNDIEAHALTELQANRPVGEYKLVEGKSSRCWKNEKTAEAAIKKNRNIKAADMYSKKLLSAPQFEKKFGKGHKILKDHMVKPQGKPVMVPGTDPRSPYQVRGEDVFTNVSDGKEN